LRAQILSDALPGVTLRGSVSFITPQSDPMSRTTPVRIQVDNPGLRLRPGMFVRSIFDIQLGANVLTVPRSAVIDTGTEKSVYLALPDGVFQRRTIQAGTPNKDFYPVTNGLSEGDIVVTHGTFLVDSQTRLADSMTGLLEDRFFRSTERPLIASRFEPSGSAGRSRTTRPTSRSPTQLAIPSRTVRITIVMPGMPAMGMAEMRGEAELPWVARITGTILVGMAGSWNVVIEARRGNQLLATYRTRFDASSGMINRLIEISLKNRFLVLLAYARSQRDTGHFDPLNRRHSRSGENQVIVFTIGAQSAGSRRSDHVSSPSTSRVCPAFNRALVIGVRLFDGQYHFEDSVDVYFAPRACSNG
jgi:hypothetical protein